MSPCRYRASVSGSMRDPAPRSSSAATAAGERTLQSRVMTEMRQHLIRINREKMMER